MAHRFVHHRHHPSVAGAFLLFLLGIAQGAAAEDSRQAARSHYASGLEFARRAEFEPALREFLTAYALSPHFAVLYNISQAEIALGHYHDAITHLSRYMRDGEGQVSPDRYQKVKLQIAVLKSTLADRASSTGDGRRVGRAPPRSPLRLSAEVHRAAATSAEKGVDPPARSSGEKKDGKEVPPHPSSSSQAPTDALAESPSTLAGQETEPVRSVKKSTRSTQGYLVGGLGVALGGAALGVYLRNMDRYQDWRDGNAALQYQPMGSAAYRAQADRNNALAKSLTTTRITILGLSIAGAVLLAAGSILVAVDRPPEHHAPEISFFWDAGTSADIAWSGTW